MRNNRFSVLAPLVVVAVIIAISSLCIIPEYVHEGNGAQRSVIDKVIPFDADLDNTGCGGELVRAHGEIHFFTSVVRPNDRDLQITTELELHDIEAVGLESGNKYQVTNMVIMTNSADAGRSSEVVKNATVGFQLRGPDKGDDIFVRDFRLIVGVGGQVTVDDSKVRIVCGNQRIL
jgi:hypothetical protein